MNTQTLKNAPVDALLGRSGSLESKKMKMFPGSIWSCPIFEVSSFPSKVLINVCAPLIVPSIAGIIGIDHG